MMESINIYPSSDEAKFLDLPWKARWEALKPLIVELYTGNHGPHGKTMTMRQVSMFMKSHYSFYAEVNQYTTKLRAWGIQKRILTTEKKDIASVLGKRPRPVASTSMATINQGGLIKPVNKKKMTRYLRNEIHRFCVETMVPGIFSSWNLPYAAYVSSIISRPDAPSPFGTVAKTPEYLNILSPTGSRSPGSPTGQSSTMQLIHQKAFQQRSNSLLQGNFEELLSSCNRDDRMLLTNYLHDYYIHSFVSAKYWGKGPKLWTPGMISALTLNSWDVAGHAETALGRSPSAVSDPDEFGAPTKLCRWVIHCIQPPYESIPESMDVNDKNDLDDPSSWVPWPSKEKNIPSFSESMKESLMQDAFSSTKPENVPISMQLVKQSLQKDPGTIRTDAWKFAIMAGNIDAIDSLLREDVFNDWKEICPYHTAAAFLDGGNSCCRVISNLVDDTNYVRLDKFEHTVLDTLMVSIIRSHTNTPPRLVSPSFHDMIRYPGEEKDICGRWDADSPAIRKLFQNGHSRIPSGWKHPFCHTSAQAVCHSYIQLRCFRDDIYGSRSGLFLRHCGHCGLQLKPYSLHAFVIMSFYLAENGKQGETMFGALAFLVCLLRLGADFKQEAEISVEDILGTADQDECYHSLLNTRALMEKVPANKIKDWTEECRTGWRCIYKTLCLAEEGDIGELSKSSSSGKCNCGGTVHWRRGVPCGNSKMGTLWACIQTELLTYRRIEEGDPWISENFSMDALRRWLDDESEEFETPLVTKEMMKDHSRCGWFGDLVPVAKDVCKKYFMNMEDYKRATFIPDED